LLVGLDWDTAWQDAVEDSQLAVLARELRFVHSSAVPSAHMLTTAATALRANRKRLAEQLAQELAIRLVLPTGICLLPSFILLGIVPIVLSLLPRRPTKIITKYSNQYPPPPKGEHHETQSTI